MFMKFKKLYAGLLVGLASLGMGQVNAEEFTKAQIETIIHDYIINNPDVLIEAQDKITQRLAEKAKVEKNKALLDIYADKAIPRSGPANAKHKIIEFFDYNCGYCKKARPLILKTLENYKDVEYLYLEFPILSEISTQAAQVGIAIYATDKSKYKEYNDTLMTRNERLTNEIQLQSLVENLGLNWSEIKKLSQGPQVAQTILKIRSFAKKFNVNGTPAFIIDGETLHGAPTSKTIIESYLKK